MASLDASPAHSLEFIQDSAIQSRRTTPPAMGLWKLTNDFVTVNKSNGPSKKEYAHFGQTLPPFAKVVQLASMTCGRPHCHCQERAMADTFHVNLNCKRPEANSNYNSSRQYGHRRVVSAEQLKDTEFQDVPILRQIRSAEQLPMSSQNVSPTGSTAPPQLHQLTPCRPSKATPVDSLGNMSRASSGTISMTSSGAPSPIRAELSNVPQNKEQKSTSKMKPKRHLLWVDATAKVMRTVNATNASTHLSPAKLYPSKSTSIEDSSTVMNVQMSPVAVEKMKIRSAPGSVKRPSRPTVIRWRDESQKMVEKHANAPWPTSQLLWKKSESKLDPLQQNFDSNSQQQHRRSQSDPVSGAVLGADVEAANLLLRL